MDEVKMLRENTRRLEMYLDRINCSDCCCMGVNTSECFALVEIGRKPGISGKELAGILGLDKSAISRIVEELVKKKHVERKTSETDRRFVVLTLTKGGEAIFRKIEADMDERFAAVLEKIPEKKRKTVIESLKVYCDAFEEVSDEA